MWNSLPRPALLVLGLATTLSLTGCILIDADEDGCCRTDIVVREPFSSTVRVGTQTRLRLEAINGMVEITGSPTARSVRVEGEKRVGSFSQRDAERHLDLLDVVILDRTDEILVRTDQPDDDGRNYAVDYVITLPADLFVVVQQVNGNVTISAVDHGVALDNVNGNAILVDVIGSTTVYLVNGNIDGAITLPPDGAIDLATTNGNVTLAVPRTTSATFEATVTNGTINVSDLPLANVVESGHTLSGVLGDGDGTVALRAVNGTITARAF